MRRAVEPLPSLGRQITGFLQQSRDRIEAEEKANAIAVPAVEMGGLAEIGIAAQKDAAEAAFAAQRDRLVKVGRRSVVGRTVARTIHEIERFLGIRQRDEQWVVAPVALERDVHALLAFAERGRDRAVAVDHGFPQEGGWLASPDLPTRLINSIHQGIDLLNAETVTEISGGGRVRHAPCAEGIEVGLVLAAELEILDAGAATEMVVRDVQHVVRLVVGQMPFDGVQ